LIHPDRWTWPSRRFVWADVAWVVFAIANLFAMFVFASWETVPFHFIWVSLTILYGFRVWSITTTGRVLGAIILVTGAALIFDISRGTQPLDEVTEVPLMSAMFLAMVWHARRRLAATEEIQRVSEANSRLLERERQFIQNASHELRTPITIALGHAELVHQARDPGTIAEDSLVVVQELMRLRRLAERLLLLAAADDPDFLHKTPMEVEPMLVEAVHRWLATPRQWRLGTTDEVIVDADVDRLALAIDALVENAVKHTQPNDWIELSVRRNHGVEIEVADSGSGIPTQDLERIFERFASADTRESRDAGSLGLGLSIVKTVAEAHGGSVRVRSQVGKGSAFELVLAEASPTGTSNS
jgi:signal transduction histidine kinase